MGDNGEGKVAVKTKAIIKGDAMVCGNCGFCGPIVARQTGEVNQEVGICRRYPPVVIMVNTQLPVNVIGVQGRPPGPAVVSHPQSFLPPVDLNNPACGEFVHCEVGNGA